MDEYDRLYSILQKRYISIDVLRSLISEEHVKNVKPCGVTEDGKQVFEVDLDNGDKNIVYIIDKYKDFAHKLDNFFHKFKH